ncbi:hypothetical protein T07_7263 [Trichinella nelsoni]|uniref:Uncharacterized protein n=1 Tax=Trichinella nelsoni TaxID=6336 RepID=A0A0V0RDJ4_9BILA|nr:hypothetical protein T07_7263 [Trichinella nelsoni]
MKIGICPERYSHMRQLLRIRLQLLKCCVCKELRRTNEMNIIAIVGEEPYGRRPLLFIGIVKQVLNILNVADVSLGEGYQLIIFGLIWHFWNHMDEPHRARYFSIFQSLLHAPVVYCTTIKPVSFANNGLRELKETPWSNRKIPCQAIMFGVSEKRPSSN